MSATAATTTATAIDENRRRAIAAVLPGRRAGDGPPGPFGRRGRRRARLAAGRAAARRRDGHRPARTCCSASSPPIARRCCSPIAEAGVVGAAHAGWRGALAGVTDATIAAMEQLGARRERIAAAVGPCIAPAVLRGRRGFPRALRRRRSRQRALLRRRPAGKPHFDLEAYVVHRLIAAGHRRGRSARPRHLCRRRPLLQLPPRHPSRRSRLRATSSALSRLPLKLSLTRCLIGAARPSAKARRQGEPLAHRRRNQRPPAPAPAAAAVADQHRQPQAQARRR